MSVKSENKNVEKRVGSAVEANVEFGLVDPRSLLIETNVRAEANLTARFLKTIREDGVRVPVVVQRTEQGLRVRTGQRRTLAAIEAGLESIPAMIVQGDEDQVRRLREQMSENDDRQGLRHADRVAAFEQMALLGVPAVEIANSTGHSTGDVKAALKVASTKKAKAVQAKYDLTLDQAAVLAEFEDDAEAIKDLTETAIKNPGAFNHTAQRRRDDREAAIRLAEAGKALADSGIKRITNWATEVSENRTARELHQLQTGDGKPLTPEAHALCPHRAAHLSPLWNGKIHPKYVCLDYKSAGHELRRSGTNDARTEQEKEAARAERAEVIANNKAWKSAQTVRRQWLAEFAARKTTPKDASVFLAKTVIGEAYSIEKASQSVHDLARELLGLKTGGGLSGRQPLYDLIARSTPARALHITLVLTLAAIEDRTGVHTWRSPGSEARYLGTLESWGYTLSDVEQIARGPQEAPARTVKKAETPKPTNTKAPTAPSPTKATQRATPKTADATAATGNDERPTGEHRTDNPVKAPVATRTASDRTTTGVGSRTATTRPEQAKRGVKTGTPGEPKRTPEPAKQ